jgi:thymidylate synthase (FAD)
MSVKLVSYSQPSPEFLDKSGMQDLKELVAYTARISNPSNQMNTETTDKLINYLAEHKHWSVFEQVSVCMEINTTRDIARQILRHRSFSFQEFSQRYANPNDLDEMFTTREARLQDIKNRQNSIKVSKWSPLPVQWEAVQREVIAVSSKAYNWAIDQGIAKEQARAVLPEGLTMSRMYVNGTLRSWIHFIELRAANGTQREHQLIAIECAKVLKTIYPLDITI